MAHTYPWLFGSSLILSSVTQKSVSKTTWNALDLVCVFNFTPFCYSVMIRNLSDMYIVVLPKQCWLRGIQGNNFPQWTYLIKSEMPQPIVIWGNLSLSAEHTGWKSRQYKTPNVDTQLIFPSLILTPNYSESNLYPVRIEIPELVSQQCISYAQDHQHSHTMPCLWNIEW